MREIGVPVRQAAPAHGTSIMASSSASIDVRPPFGTDGRAAWTPSAVVRSAPEAESGPVGAFGMEDSRASDVVGFDGVISGFGSIDGGGLSSDDTGAGVLLERSGDASEDASVAASGDVSEGITL